MQTTRRDNAQGRRASVRASVPLVVGAAVTVAVALLALRLGDANLKAAEADRLEARRAMTTSIARNLGLRFDPAATADAVRRLPLTPGHAVIDQATVDRLGSVTPGSTIALAALVDPQGGSLAALPAGRQVDVGQFGASWAEALAGRAATTSAFRYDGEVCTAVLVPLGEGPPWAVMVLVEQASGSSHDQFVRKVGALTDQPGGVVVFDRQGTVVDSWDPGQVGRPVLTAAEVAALPAGDTVVRTGRRGSVETTEVAVRLPNGFAVVLGQDTDRLYGDLRQLQEQRTRTLVAVLAGTLVGLVGFQVTRERSARRAGSRFRALLSDSRDLVVVTDAEGQVRFVSPAIEGLLGLPAEAWTSRRLSELAHPDDTERLSDLVTRPSRGPELNVRLRHAHGEFRWFDIEASDHRTHRSVGGILLTGHEISQRKALEDELAFLAHHDSLTGLPNRDQFRERLEARFAAEAPVRPAALVYVDLDHFKPINDSLGHDAGDHVLAVVGGRLIEAAGPDGFVCRFGGDEFGVLVEVSDSAAVFAIARQVLESVRAPIAVGATLAQIDASIGIAFVTAADAGNPEALVRRADQAMYEAKRSGRGRWVVAPEAVASDAPAPARPVISAPPDEPAPPAAAGPPDAPAPAHAPAAGPASAVHRKQRWLAHLGALVVVVSIVAGIAGIGTAQSVAARRDAEAQLLEDRGSEVLRSVSFFNSVLDPQRLAAMATSIPWAFDGSALDQAIVNGFQQSPLSGPGGTAHLAAVDGRVLASAPAGSRAPIGPDDPHWRRAVAGRAVNAVVAPDPADGRALLLLPIMRDGRAAGLLVLDAPARASVAQREIEIAGSVGSQFGGWSLLDSDGTVTGSWNPDLVGQVIAERDVLAPLPPGQYRTATTRTGDVLVLAQLGAGDDPEAPFFAFSMPPDEFYRDLRAGQGARDAALLLVVVTAVIGLALVNHRRELDTRRHQERLDALLQHAHDVTMVVDYAGRPTFVSSAARELLGYEPDDLLDIDLLDLVHPEDWPRVAAVVGDVAAPRSALIDDVRIRSADGTDKWFDVDVINLRSDPHVGAVVLVGHDVTVRKRLQDELARRARVDPLTNLPNRAALAQHLDTLTADRAGPPFAVLFVDLDRFKPINDELGHHVGDEVLRLMAGRLRETVRDRQLDSPDGAADVICRWGGDEFAVLLHEVSADEARSVADRLLESARRPITVAAATIRLGATIGIALSHPERPDADIAVREADLAMYQAKEAGRDRYVFFKTAGDR